MQGADPADPVCANKEIQKVSPAVKSGISGVRIGLAGGYFEENCEPAVYEAVKKAAATLGTIKGVEIPFAAQGRGAAFVITASEGAQLHLPNMRKRLQDFEPIIQERLVAGALIPASWYLQAQRVRRVYYRKVMELFQSVDVILAPATPRPAHRIGQETFTIRGREMPSRANTGILTQPISCLGLPVVCAPVGEVEGMPVGMQIIAAPWREDLCFRVAGALR
jgi:aspartyl-tRNA(Asn)/glutamyl-tRNA(Gln) amidotransferase subunit A